MIHTDDSMHKELNDFWRMQVDSAIYSLTQVKEDLPESMSRKVISKKGAAALRSLRAIIPYCLHPAGNNGSMILVNRNYLPLGLTVPGFVKYDHFRWMHVPKPPEGLLDHNGRLYLFSDRSAPWRSKGALENMIGRLQTLLKEM